MKQRTFPATIITMTLVLAAGALADLSAEPLRLLAWEAQPECRCTADLSEELPAGLEEAARALGIETELETVPRGELFQRLSAMLAEGNPPDLVWVAEDRIGDLARIGEFLPITEFAHERPWLLEGLDDQALEGFTFEGMLYALPLDRDGELSGIGQAITWAALERGRVEAALELAGFLKDRLPPRPIPDVVASLTLDHDDLVEQDQAVMISEIFNAGDAPSEGMPMHFLVDGEPVAEMWVEPLEPGQHTTVEAAIQLPYPGEHLFSGRLDTSNLFFEANRNNDAGELGQLVQPLFGGLPPAPKSLGNPMTLHGAAFHNRVDSQRHVRVAFDGTNFLVAWFIDEPLFNKAGTRRIVGTRVTPAGAILDPTGINITTTKDRYQSFDLAFDGQRYLVVWERDLGVHLAKTVPNPFSRVEGVRVSKGGVVLDSTPILIEGQPCSGCPANYSAWQYTAPQVVSTNAGFLVVYRRRLEGGTQFEDRIVGRFVSGGGGVNPGRTTLVSLNAACQPVYGQSLAFNTVRGEGLLIFDAYDYTNLSQYKQKIAAVWLKLQGTSLVASPPKTVTSILCKPGSRLDRPEVAAAPNGTFFGAFESDAGKGSYSWPDIHGIHFGTWSTKAVSYKGAVVKGSLEMHPALDWDGKNYGMVFSHGTCSPLPGVVMVTQGGKMGTRSIPYKNAGGVNDIDIAFGAGKGLVVYTREFSGQTHPSKYKYKIDAFFIKATP